MLDKFNITLIPVRLTTEQNTLADLLSRGKLTAASQAYTLRVELVADLLSRFKIRWDGACFEDALQPNTLGHLQPLAFTQILKEEWPLEDAIWINPPFARLDDLIDCFTSTERPLRMLICVPAWTDQKWYHQLCGIGIKVRTFPTASQCFIPTFPLVDKQLSTRWPVEIWWIQSSNIVGLNARR